MNDRLNKLTALLDSPVEGERWAALEAVNRLLKASGLRWVDLNIILPQSRARPQMPQPRTDPAGWADWMVRNHHEKLSLWELGFLDSIKRRRPQHFTTKQSAVVSGIISRMEQQQ